MKESGNSSFLNSLICQINIQREKMTKKIFSLFKFTALISKSQEFVESQIRDRIDGDGRRRNESLMAFQIVDFSTGPLSYQFIANVDGKKSFNGW